MGFSSDGKEGGSDGKEGCVDGGGKGGHGFIGEHEQLLLNGEEIDIFVL